MSGSGPGPLRPGKLELSLRCRRSSDLVPHTSPSVNILRKGQHCGDIYRRSSCPGGQEYGEPYASLDRVPSCPIEEPWAALATGSCLTYRDPRTLPSVLCPTVLLCTQLSQLSRLVPPRAVSLEEGMLCCASHLPLTERGGWQEGLFLLENMTRHLPLFRPACLLSLLAAWHSLCPSWEAGGPCSTALQHHKGLGWGQTPPSGSGGCWELAGSLVPAPWLQANWSVGRTGGLAA